MKWRLTKEGVRLSEKVQKSAYNSWMSPELESDEGQHESVSNKLLVRQGHHQMNGYELKNYGNVYQQFRDLAGTVLDELPSDALKKERIATLKLVFGNDVGCPSDYHLGGSVSASKSYIPTFDYYPSEKVVIERASPTSSKLSEIRDRDDGCVNCGATANLVVHHIITRSDGGSDSPENLATLCKACHLDVHPSWSETVYDSVDGFWEWTNQR